MAIDDTNTAGGGERVKSKAQLWGASVKAVQVLPSDVGLSVSAWHLKLRRLAVGH